MWTVGLLIFAHLASIALFYRFPNFRLVAHSTAISLAAVALIAAGLSQVKRGMSPFNMLRVQLSSVRDGRSPRIQGNYPGEVQPLVHDLNSLLEQRQQAIDRAQAKAGDLAHGLKTPLAILVQEAERLQSAGHGDAGLVVRQQAERMQRQIDYHLAQARLASGPSVGVHCSVREVAEALVRTLHRLYAERDLRIDIDISAGDAVTARQEDLEEMLGNLLDNACKWAKGHVVVASEESGGDVLIHVDDDGEGLPAEMRNVVIRRGVRADEKSGGSGLGLAIVHDLAELYGGSLFLETSPLGGLRANLRVPRWSSSLSSL
jgi:signal transduction histidine kinase